MSAVGLTVCSNVFKHFAVLKALSEWDVFKTWQNPSYFIKLSVREKDDIFSKIS